ncbi:hypothetical protein ACWT_1376 [Actinoplanes sp. SE50]|uniref:hypothetical protein n=1 Tax=Actinoplanes sp. SE50 TaxID=2033844 RepID=UPI00023EBEA8|nr:hypothetical protein [Actinoplanes sp. SE50]AEV82394.1 hypothetical protein ACPL_1497 [Actinoplanes sp. SE50/110]ATO80791.1 hypothetical protein ACWT_1376 [Actinoplanes sp. SE50]SLL98199.1 hypothetical protein ACSP50_1423 [Actinoplanes sp. SE50/110]
MKPAVQPDDDPYVITNSTRKLVDRSKVDSRVLLALLDRADDPEPTTTYFTNFVS